MKIIKVNSRNKLYKMIMIIIKFMLYKRIKLKIIRKKKNLIILINNNNKIKTHNNFQIKGKIRKIEKKFP